MIPRRKESLPQPGTPLEVAVTLTGPAVTYPPPGRTDIPVGILFGPLVSTGTHVLASDAREAASRVFSGCYRLQVGRVDAPTVLTVVTTKTSRALRMADMIKYETVGNRPVDQYPRCNMGTYHDHPQAWAFDCGRVSESLHFVPRPAPLERLIPLRLLKGHLERQTVFEVVVIKIAVLTDPLMTPAAKATAYYATARVGALHASNGRILQRRGSWSSQVVLAARRGTANLPTGTIKRWNECTIHSWATLLTNPADTM